MSSPVSPSHQNTLKVPKRSPWKWWNSNKVPDNKINDDCASSIARSSLLVNHSVHSKESVDILSTASVKSKPWASQRVKSASLCPPPTEQEQEEDEFDTDQNTIEILQPQNRTETNTKNIRSSSITENATPSSSLLNNVPSVNSSTLPVVDFDPNDYNNRKNSDGKVFSGMKAKFGRWVNRTDR